MKRLHKLSYKILFTIFFFALAGIVFFLKIGSKTTKVSAAWWNDSWHYRRTISISNNTSSDATNIPYLIKLDTQNLITAGKLQSDADDIRVVDSNGNLIRSQIEKFTLNTEETGLWIEVNVKSNTSSTYYVYYGNSTVSASTFDSDISSVTSTTSSVSVTTSDGFGYTTSSTYGRIANITKDGESIGVNGTYRNSTSYPGWWDDQTFTQTILNESGPLFTEINYDDTNYSSYSDYGTNIKIFKNGYIENQIYVTYNTSGSENFYYYLHFDSGTRNSVWVDGSNNLVDQSSNSGNLYESNLGQNWFGQRWTDTNNYGGNIITKNGSDWQYGYTSAQSSYYQTNYSYSESFESGDSRKIRFGTFAGDGGLSEMTQKGANYGGLSSSSNSEEAGGGPIAYWKFDEGSGTTAYDSTGTNNGTIYGTTYSTEDQCISGKCLYFNGTTSDYVTIPNSQSLQIVNSQTISMWLKPTAFGTRRNPINKAYGGEGTITLETNGSMTYYWGTAGANNTPYQGVASSGTLTLDTWNYISLVRDLINNKIYWYINGKKTHEVTPSYAQATASTYDLIIGKGYAGNFIGYIDEVKIYPYARTADQIKTDYNSRGTSSGSSVNLGIQSNTAPSLKDSLIAYYKFDENNGTTAYDSSNNNNTAIITDSNWSNSGKFNKAISLGSTNAIITSNAIYNNTQTFTLSAYIYPTETSSFKVITGTSIGNNLNSGLILQNNNLCYHDYSTNSSDYSICSTDNPIVLNKWQHVTLTYDNGIINLYVDGKNIKTASFIKTNTNNTLVIGRGTGYYSNRNYIGLIDEVKVYNKALTANEVKQDYNYGSSVKFGSTTQNIGGTTTSLDYCIPGDTSYCAAPIAEWKMDEGVGTSIVDTSGNNNTGTLGTGDSAPTWTQGKIGKSMGFSGTQQFINIPSSSSLNINNNQVTLSLWVKLNKLPSQIPGSYSGIYDSASDSYVIYLEKSAGDLKFKITDSDSTAERPSIPESLLTTNKWYQVTGVYDGNNGTAKIYLDGKLIDTHTNASLIDNVKTGQIGRIGDAGSSDRFLDGSIDQIRVYDYARTPAQIAYDYNRGAPVGWWKMDECQGSTVYDWSENDNNGTISIGSSGSQNSLGTCQVGTSAAWTTGSIGKLNGSLNFDGVDDVVNIGTTYPNNNFSIALWLKRTGTIDYTYSWAGVIGNRQSTEMLRGIALSSDQIIYKDYQGTPSSLSSNITTTLNQWYHTVVTYNGSILNLYVDGLLKNSYNNPTLSNNATSTTQIGAINWGTLPNRSFNGQIDDVRIYNYALTSEQVKTIYNNGAVNFN